MKSSRKRPQQSIDISETSGVRYLHFGSDWVQGAMRIARPWALELAYTREMMTGLLLHPEKNWPRTALLIGLGAGSLVKFIYRHLPLCRMTVIEIDPQVSYVAQQYFKVPDDPKRIDLLIGDGADYILSGEKTFDLILLDGFDADAKAGALDTLPFYLACRARLSEIGLLSVNLLGRNKGFQASVDRITSAFDGQVSILPACDSGNTIALCGTGMPITVSLDLLEQRAEQLKIELGLDLLSTVNRLQNAAVQPPSNI